jgi:hypothetical protein
MLCCPPNAFILTGDTDWTVDVCTAVPQGYNIVGVYDIDGNMITTNNCVQAGVVGETKVIAFEVLDLQSPPPHLTAKLKIHHKGKDRIDQFEIAGTERERIRRSKPGSLEKGETGKQLGLR